MNYSNISVSWNKYPNSIHIHNNTINLVLNLGDCIIYNGRELPIRIDKIAGSEEGPIGFEYLPWRGERWGTPTITLRGNPRFIICPPTGLPHYGQHIDWESIQIVPNPTTP